MDLLAFVLGEQANSLMNTHKQAEVFGVKTVTKTVLEYCAENAPSITPSPISLAEYKALKTELIKVQAEMHRLKIELEFERKKKATENTFAPWFP